MKQIMKKIDFLKVAEIVAVFVLALLPLFAFADLSSTFRCDPQFQNCSTTNINGLIRLVINWLLAIAFGIAVLFLIIGGFWYITSAGNEETAEKGKNTIVNALIGIVVIILSYVIVSVVSNMVTSPTVSAP